MTHLPDVDTSNIIAQVKSVPWKTIVKEILLMEASRAVYLASFVRTGYDQRYRSDLESVVNSMDWW